MSLLRAPLNLYLRATEKPHMARARDPVRLRRSFERKAKLLFWPPLGTVYRAGHLGSRPAVFVNPNAAPGRPYVLYFHGGAYIFGSPDTHKAMLARLCTLSNAQTVLPDYRKAPENPFPAAVDDAEAAYLEILNSGVPATQIVLGGDSAGGGLALALLARILARGHAKPAGCFTLSPLTDMTYSGASIAKNAASDVVLPVSQIPLLQKYYLAGHDPKDPEASPLFADFQGSPPVWLAVSDSEILEDDSRRMAAKLKNQGVDVSLSVSEGLPHVWPIFQTILPEARSTLRQLADWVTRTVQKSAES